MSFHSFARKEVTKLVVCFPNVTKEKLAQAVQGFADVQDFAVDPANEHVATVTLAFRQPCTWEEGALHFGGTDGSLVVLGRELVTPGVKEPE